MEVFMWKKGVIKMFNSVVSQLSQSTPTKNGIQGEESKEKGNFGFCFDSNEDVLSWTQMRLVCLLVLFETFPYHV